MRGRMSEQELTPPHGTTVKIISITKDWIEVSAPEGGCSFWLPGKLDEALSSIDDVETAEGVFYTNIIMDGHTFPVEIHIAGTYGFVCERLQHLAQDDFVTKSRSPVHITLVDAENNTHVLVREPGCSWDQERGLFIGRLGLRLSSIAIGA